MAVSFAFLHSLQNEYMSSSKIGTLTLGARFFSVKSARISRHNSLWEIHIETEYEEYDGERWAPSLYHQGLLADTFEDAGPLGNRVSWTAASDSAYRHPESGFMYVFGHHDVRSCVMTFGIQTGRFMEIKWSGKCDVFWDDEFGENVSFDCTCNAVVDD